jgi:uncharacterized membrane protein
MRLQGLTVRVGRLAVTGRREDEEAPGTRGRSLPRGEETPSPVDGDLAALEAVEEGVSPRDDAFRDALGGAVRFGCRHWLFAANLTLMVFSTLPVLAPILAALGFESVSNAIFVAYSLTCHQMPSRSYFIFGHQMAYCERNTAIYFSMAFAGLAYARLRRQGLRPLPMHWYLVLIFPMALDGFTQLFGWRESTWLLRGITGTLFGVSTIWLTFPHLQESFDEIEREL